MTTDSVGTGTPPHNRAMGLQDVVVCSGGLRVAQRGAGAPVDAGTLRVAAVAPVGRPNGPPLETRRSDDVVWRRHWLEEDRLTIEFVGLALVRVEEGSGTVTFDRLLSADMEQHLLLDQVVPLVLAGRGELVVHGAVISRGGLGAVLLGSSGAGKSTLTAFAWQQGWTAGGDDGAVLFATDPATVEPTYATVRLTPVSADLLGIPPAATSPVAGKMRIAGHGQRAFRQEEVELRLIAIVEAAASAEQARFHPLTAIDAHARLFGSTFHAELSGTGLLPRVVDRLGAIVETVVVGRLAVPRGLEGLAAAERLLRAQLGEKASRAQLGRGSPRRASRW